MPAKRPLIHPRKGRENRLLFPGSGRWSFFHTSCVHEPPPRPSGPSTTPAPHRDSLSPPQGTPGPRHLSLPTAHNTKGGVGRPAQSGRPGTHPDYTSTTPFPIFPVSGAGHCPGTRRALEGCGPCGPRSSRLEIHGRQRGLFCSQQKRTQSNFGKQSKLETRGTERSRFTRVRYG